MIELRLCGWECKGIRAPDSKFDLKYTKNDNHALVTQKRSDFTVIQIPNGTAKSTFVTLIKEALSGAPFNSNPRDFRSNDDNVDEGNFTLKLEYKNSSDQEYKRFDTRINFDFSVNKAEFTTWRDDRGDMNTYDPPPELVGILKPDISDFFNIVSGDDDPESSGRLLQNNPKECIRRMVGLEQINKLINQMESKKNEKINSIGPETGNRTAVTRMGLFKIEAIRRRDDINHNKSFRKDKIKNLEKEIEKLDEKNRN